MNTSETIEGNSANSNRIESGSIRSEDQASERDSRSSLPQAHASGDDPGLVVPVDGDQSTFNESAQHSFCGDQSGQNDEDNNGNLMNTSWYDLEKNAEKLLRDELYSVESSFSPEMQLNFFKSWFERNFKNSFLYGHFLSLSKYALYEHMPDMTLDKDYVPSSLLTLMRKCLASYRVNVKDLEETVGQLNRKVAETLEESFDGKEECRQSLKEIILSYQQILASATERSINSRQQAESLRIQLSEALAHIHHLENKLIMSEKSSVKIQDTLAGIRNETSSRDELEKMVAIEKALTDSLKFQLGDEQRSNQRLWTTLKDKTSHLAVLEAELATYVDDASRKSRLINILAEEVVETLHETLPQEFTQQIPDNFDAASAGSAISVWENNLKNAIEARNKEIQKLDRQLVDCELLMTDLSYKLADKQETIKYLEVENASLQQEEENLRAKIENQDSYVRNLQEKSKQVEKKITLVRQGLDKKLDLLTCTKDRLEKNVREIARLQKTRISVPRDDIFSESSSFLEPSSDYAVTQSTSQPLYSSSEAQNAIKTFASFEGSRFIRRSSREASQWCSTPIEGQDQGRLKYPPMDHYQLKKTASFKSPFRHDQNVRFKSAENFKQMKREASSKRLDYMTATSSGTRRTVMAATKMGDTSCAGDTLCYERNKDMNMRDTCYRPARSRIPSVERKQRDNPANVSNRQTWSNLNKTRESKNVVGMFCRPYSSPETGVTTGSNEFTVPEVRPLIKDPNWRYK